MNSCQEWQPAPEFIPEYEAPKPQLEIKPLPVKVRLRYNRGLA